MTADQQIAQPSNGLGTAGFVVSLVAILSCGLISPIGLILSLIGLRKQPKRLAIAGSIIGGVGSLFGALMGAGIIVGFLSVGKYVETEAALQEAAAVIEGARAEGGSLPTESEGTALIAEFKDGWANSLRYRTTGESFTITSAGLDGLFDTADDRTYPTEP